MNRRSPLSLLATGLWVVACLCACAVPATQVEVPTMSMRNALDLARQPSPSAPAPPDPVPRLAPAPIPKGAPRPMLSSPDVRLAYLYEWVDAEGNKHFGEWVAIPVAGFDWIMSDGAQEAIDGSDGLVPPTQEVH